jgi:hypothetical protein
MMAAVLPQLKQYLASRKALIACIAFALNTDLSGQSTPIYALQAEYGFLILHSEDIAPIGPSNPRGIGVDISWSLDPEQHYQNCLCFPRLGISLNYHHLDKPNILGSAFPIYGFIEPHYRIFKDSFFYLRAGIGFSFQSLPFDEESNPLNLSYSRYLNTYVELGIGFEYRFSDLWGIRTGFHYNHSSNGGIQEPNKGLNYPTLTIGINRALRALPDYAPISRQNNKPEARKQFDIQAFLAGKSFDESRVTYAVYGVEFSYLHQFNRLSAIDIGFEFTQNDAYAEIARQEDLDQSTFEANVLVGHSFVMGKFTFSQQAGIYLWRDYARTPDWFQRYGVQYYLWKGWSIGTNIRVHGHVAEFLDFRMGYSFPRKEKH